MDLFNSILEDKRKVYSVKKAVILKVSLRMRLYKPEVLTFLSFQDFENLHSFFLEHICMMILRVHLCLLVLLFKLLVIAALTNPNDYAALQALKNTWKNVPPNWVGPDPCGKNWDGLSCLNNRVVSITLASINLSGQLLDITKLSELQILDLSYNKGMTGPLPPTIGNLKKLSSLILVGCGFSGPIPASIGSLQNLVYMSLNSNNFVGEIPPSIGNLSNLYWLDLADNKLTGTIPVSSGSTPGLDMLLRTKHFHLGKNQLSGEIPSQLFSSDMALIHLLLENNKLTGSIPSSMGLVQTLEVVRLDRNLLNGSVPENLNNLTNVQELFLANNRLAGPFPDLTGMELLNYVDMSNNSFEATEDIPLWFSSLQSLTSLIMEDTQIQGQLPVSMFSNLFQLQTVSLKNNRVNGTLNIGSTYSTQLQLIDLQNNSIDAFTHRAGQSSNVKIILMDNPICTEGTTGNYYCAIPDDNTTSTIYSTPPENCTPDPCSSEKVSSPTCKCAYPYTGTLYFRAPSFSNLENSSVFVSLQKKLMDTWQTHGLPVDSVALSDPTKNMDNYLSLNLEMFPFGQDYFNRTGISWIGFMLSNQTFKPPKNFGPFFFIANMYPYFEKDVTAGVSHKSSNMGVKIGSIIVGAIVFFGLVALLVYCFKADDPCNLTCCNFTNNISGNK